MRQTIGVMESWSAGVMAKTIVSGCELRVARSIFQPVTRNTQLATSTYRVLY
jgi:hypothetical protein